MKVGGRTSGMISPRLRASTIESSGDVMVRMRLEVKADTYPTPRVEGRRAVAVRLRTPHPILISHGPKNDLNMTSGKKAETKVATLKGPEGGIFFEMLSVGLTASVSRGCGIAVPQTRMWATVLADSL